MSALGEPGMSAPLGLAGALALSAIVHVTLLSAGGFTARSAATGGGSALQVRLVSQPDGGNVSPPQTSTAPDQPRRSPTLPGARRIAEATSPARGEALPASDQSDGLGNVERAPRAQSPIALASFDPTRYLTSRQVDRGLLPADPDLLDRIPFSGTGPGEWLTRIFVNEEGSVDEIEFLESRGSQTNTEELRAYLAAARFEPARRGAEAVKSQTMLEIRFQASTPGQDLFRPSLVPSAKGR
jgi:hypothetical protein